MQNMLMNFYLTHKKLKHDVLKLQFNLTSILNVKKKVLFYNNLYLIF